MNTSINTLFCFTLFVPIFGYAEIATDGTTGAMVAHTLAPTLAGGKDFVIPQELGTKMGSNLFHSFSTFNINGESATFTGDASLKNVISRVTGGHYSLINGSLNSTIGQANFYFINPAGVLFGPAAQINVPAAFHVSTADVLRFSDGSLFNMALDTASTLSIAEPTSFGFLGNANNEIRIWGAKLVAKTGQDIDLVSGKMLVTTYQNNGYVSNSEIKAEAGSIRLTAVGQNATHVPIQGVAEIANGAISIEKNSTLDVSGNGSGKLAIQAGDISVADSSKLYADNTGDKNATFEQGITISADNLTLDGANGISSIRARTSGTGQGGNMTVLLTNQLKLNNSGLGTNAGLIDSLGNNHPGAGNAGDVNVIAKIITVDNSSLNSDVFANSTGNAGTVSIKSDSLKVLNGGWIDSDTRGFGKGGGVEIDASKVVVDGQGNGAYISSDTHNAGIAGTVHIKSDSLSVLNGGQISSDTYAEGNGGKVTITANDINIDRQDNQYLTGITSNANENSTGNAGVVNIESNSLNVSNAGWILSDSYSSGNAGSINIKNNSLNISNGGVISSSTYSSGKAGTIAIEVDDTKIDGAYIFTSAFATSTNDAGMINIKGNQLIVSNGGQINSSTFGSGNAGNIAIEVKNTELNNKGAIASLASDTATGNAGTVNISGEKLTLLNGANISTDSISSSSNAGSVTIKENTVKLDSSFIHSITTGSGTAGTVDIEANDVVEMNKGKISTSTGGIGNAGNILVKSDKLNIYSAGEISSNSEGIGNAGNIDITANQITIEGQGSNISSNTKNKIIADAGHAGTITVKGNSLNIVNGGKITSETQNSGNAGNIEIDVSKIVVDGKGNATPIDTNTYNSGNAGTINVKSDDLTLLNKGLIASATMGSGNAGNINIDAGNILIDGQGNTTGITALAGKENSGQVGSINVTAKDININHGIVNISTSALSPEQLALPTLSLLNIKAQNLRLLNTAILSSASYGNANAATINLDIANALTLQNTSVIASSASSVGNAGDTTITAPLITMENLSSIKTDANLGNGGNITINGGELINLKNSGFFTSVAEAIGNGGNINVNATIVIMDNGGIQANAKGGKGGDINLNLQALIPSYNSLIKGGSPIAWKLSSGFSLIQAASEQGVNGTLNITSPQFDISGSISGLDASGLTLPVINRDPCQDTVGSSLTHKGKGGIPLSEPEYLVVSPITMLPGDSDLIYSSEKTTLPNQQNQIDSCTPN